MAATAELDLGCREDLARAARVHPIAWALYLSRYAGDGGWRNARHFDYLADRVMAMRRGELSRLCVSMPPGSGKSEFLSLACASWWAATRPRSRVIVASYGRNLTLGWSRRARDAIAALGPEVFGVGASSREREDWWHFRDPRNGRSLGGYYYAVGRGGSVTGKRAELIVVDDLLKDGVEARSPTIRDQAWSFLDQVALTRIMPDTCVIVIGTRWHSDDPIGRLEAKQRRGEVDRPWEIVNLPALAEQDDPLGRSPGEALWPEMWPRERLEAVRRERDPSTWAALFCGRPIPEGGALFRSEWVRSYRSEREVLVAGPLRVSLDRLVRFATVDLAGSKRQRADWTVIGTWGIDHETRTLWLLDIVRERVEAPKIISTMRGVQSRMKPRAFYVEEAGPQLDLVHALSLAEAAGERIDVSAARERGVLIARAIEAGIPVRTITPSGDKVVRSAGAQALMSHGRLLTPESATWLPVYLDELVVFPDGDHDDQVDVTSYGAQVFLEVLAANSAVAEHDEGPRFEPLGDLS